MDKQLKIIYHYNSGFSVQVGSTLLIFDYWEGEGRTLAPGRAHHAAVSTGV